MSTACVPLVAQLLLFNFLAKQLKGNLFALINERGFSTALHIVHSEHTNNTVIHWVADMTSIFFFWNSTFQKHEQIATIVCWFALKTTSNAIGVQKKKLNLGHIICVWMCACACLFERWKIVASPTGLYYIFSLKKCNGHNSILSDVHNTKLINIATW